MPQLNNLKEIDVSHTQYGSGTLFLSRAALFVVIASFFFKLFAISQWIVGVVRLVIECAVQLVGPQHGLESHGL
jgi:hypothetical protein